jgi:catechol 2,3-dioxygenase-like lactoylglutathione lyase family enzyme
MRIHHVAMRTLDLPRLEAFYAGVLGLSVLRRDDARGSVWLDLDGAVLMLERAAPGEPDVPQASLELLALAIDLSAREAFRAKLAVEAETTHTLYFRDPDGRRVALSSYPLPSP